MFDCFICLGSNYQQDIYYAKTRFRLQEIFPTIVFADSIETKPIEIKRKDSFINQIAYFKTTLSSDEVNQHLKNIELECGRTIDDKLLEIIKMDIDLLIYDNHILKPKDITHSYVINGLKQLQEIIKTKE